MTTGKLHHFATSAIARGQVTFGDVRRLQRDYLPGGITTREDAEILLSLSNRLVRADRAWAQWLVAQLARYLTQEGSGACIEDAGRDWLGTLLAASPAPTALGRRIARYIRRELPKLMATKAAKTQAATGEPQPVEPCPALTSQLMGSIVRSEIVTRPDCRRVTRPRRRTAPMPILPAEVWAARMMEKHQRFQLGRPYI